MQNLINYMVAIKDLIDSQKGKEIKTCT